MLLLNYMYVNEPLYNSLKAGDNGHVKVGQAQKRLRITTLLFDSVRINFLNSLIRL